VLVFLATLATIARAEPYQLAEQGADESFRVLRFATREACERVARRGQAEFDRLAGRAPGSDDRPGGTRWVIRPVCLPLSNWQAD
jgi:hypothetical protein